MATAFSRTAGGGSDDELRSGRPRQHCHEQVALLRKRALSRKPARATHWSVCRAAQGEAIIRKRERLSHELTPAHETGKIVELKATKEEKFPNRSSGE